MNSQKHKKVSEVFAAARRRPLEARAAFLDEACAGDVDLRREVDSLLKIQDDSARRLDTGAVRNQIGKIAAETLGGTDDPVFPKQIGAYRIERLIASGGMGNVYLAMQERPHRQVALKVIKAGIASPSALRRFEHEAEILGRLHHKGIAQIFEGSTFMDGTDNVPFFAMEYLADAETISDFANTNGLDNRSRLELMAKVCDAVHHAHQKGIVHRDLKPGNILVDATGEPKVLDFGVARVTDADVQTTTFETAMGQLIGTVPYMSPEQCQGDPAALDIRSDVYALGVVTYELLANRLPYDLQGLPVYEAVRIIREDDPTPLSSVNKVFRGDLDTIMAKALEKDPVRRYQSTSDLAADIRRHLNNEPIAARPTSPAYRLWKFSRRNRALVSGLVVAFLAMVAGTALALGQAAEARESRDEAEIVLAFLANMLQLPRPGGFTRDTPFKTVLDRAAEKLDNEFRDRPLLEARVRKTIGVSYYGIGLLAEAEKHLMLALEFIRQELGDQDRHTIEAMNDCAPLYYWQGKYAEGVELGRVALENARDGLGEEHPITVQAMQNLGLLLQVQRKLSEAEPLCREALEITRRQKGDEDPETLDGENALGLLLRNQNKLWEAEMQFKQTLETARRALGEDHQKTLVYQFNLCDVLRKQDKLSEAEPLYRETLSTGRTLWGEQHLKTLKTMSGLASVLQGRGNLLEAEEMHRDTIERAEQSLAEDHLYTAVWRNAWGTCLTQLERYDEAEAQLLKSHDALKGNTNARPDHMTDVIGAIVDLYEAWDHPQEAADWQAELDVESDPSRASRSP